MKGTAYYAHSFENHIDHSCDPADHRNPDHPSPLPALSAVALPLSAIIQNIPYTQYEKQNESDRQTASPRRRRGGC